MATNRIEGGCYDRSDIVIGSRAVPGARIELHQPFHRESLGKLFNRLIRPLTGLPIRDTQCGFKVFRDRAAVAVFGPLRTYRFAFDVEVLFRAKQLGFPMVEVPVVWRNSPATHVRTALDGPKMLLDALRIRRIVGGMGEAAGERNGQENQQGVLEQPQPAGPRGRRDSTYDHDLLE